MEKPKVGVKVITMHCFATSIDTDPCKAVAMVQVVTQPIKERQKQIDKLANKKLRETLKREHKEGKHNV